MLSALCPVLLGSLSPVPTPLPRLRCAYFQLLLAVPLLPDGPQPASTALSVVHGVNGASPSHPPSPPPVDLPGYDRLGLRQL